ncbi:phage head closure protein [Hymenobacter sp. BT175]|uniref:phage head closure protein n=1 Tax=Hymenobacter translucens TaxID=2886507 RepID=UPI001D0E08E2|nr:phage head closure protein [Hymenobacter translucens]MCC2547713.1 phage head closure protein [Hymenobacter translucens]
MNIGKLDRRITLEQNTATQNAYGEQVPAWSEVGEVWARVDYGRGNEAVQAGEQVAIQRIDFTIRYKPGLSARLRITYEGQVYDIEAVQELGRRAGLKLSAFTRNDDGR